MLEVVGAYLGDRGIPLSVALADLDEFSVSECTGAHLERIVRWIVYVRAIGHPAKNSELHIVDRSVHMGSFSLEPRD
ncbi:hypothetical protein GCM10010974_08520 [Brevibacterium sediminis]|uniref:Uncharacterized protein n=1 Tax=Brevibacterium sediminis TaxID=1857024 RepID=A0ABQ1LS91_9MICO|nr:hypothetical protein GCM10010974_08520 [Brevibacterium sediminis]